MSGPDLGFGTAPMLGRVSRRRSLRALEHAYELGVRHFDTARSYGWGQAEGLLGGFLKDRPRLEYKVVTKCGIFPMSHSPLLGAAKSAARAVLAFAPALRGHVRKVASVQAFQPVHVGDVGTLKMSVETSLSELGLRYLDGLLLHNFGPDKPGLDDVVAWFEELKKSGKIRRYGFSVEGDLPTALDFLAQKGWLAGTIVQTPVQAALFELRPQWRDACFVVHSAFSYLSQQVAQGGRLRNLRDLRQALGDSCSCEALVCSMFTPEHIDANVAAWRS